MQLVADEAGRVSFSRLRLGSYTVFAVSQVPGRLRSAGLTNLTISAPGPAPDFALVLDGVGGVSGRVLANDGQTPAGGVTVRLQLQSPFFNDRATALADGTGHYQFTDIPVGDYRVAAESQALGASYNGPIARDGQADAADLVLSASGTVQGRMVRADGTTPVSGLDVLLTFNSVSGLPGRAVSRTDTNGLFQLANIPVGPFNLEAIALDFDGLARSSGSLTNNGQVLDLGAVRLDEADPYIVSVSPANTVAGVSIQASVELLFSEALLAGSINSSGIYLRSPDGNVPASLQLLPDPTNGIPRLVRLTPNNPLRSQVTYQVVVIDGQRQNAGGGVSGAGPTDLVGRPLPVPFLSSFTTADGDPPRLVSIFPSNSAVQIDPRSVMRLSFNEPIRDSNFTFTLTGAGGPVAGKANVGLNGLVLAFTPDAPLAVNASYTMSIDNVSDLAGNRALNQPFVATFATLDTIGPVIATLRLADGRTPIAGSTVPVEAVLATNEPGASVRFTQDFNPVGLATNSPYRVNLSLPLSGSTTLRAIATDRYGNDGPVAELGVSVVADQPPSVELRQNSPTGGAVFSGQPFSVLLDATDDVGVTNLILLGRGVLNVMTNYPNGATNIISFIVPSNAVAGDTLEFQAQATDTSGARSPAAALSLVVKDATPPSLTILSPADNAMLDPSQPLVLAVVAADNSTNVLLTLELSGALAATQTLSAALITNTPATNCFTASLAGAQLSGTPLIATVRAADAATNITTATRTFRLPDRQPPQLAGLSPAAGALGQSLWQSEVTLRFNEPIAAASLTTNSVRVRSSAGAATPYAVALDAGDSSLVHLRFLALPLEPRMTYTSIISSGLTDLAGNSWVSSGETNLVFTTAAIQSVSPTNGASVAVGQAFPVVVSYDFGLGADAFQFTLETNPPVTLSVTPGATSVQLTLLMPANLGSVRLSIAALHQGSAPYPLPDILLQAQPAATNRPPIAGTNRALRFDGVDDFVELGSWFDLQSFTIGLWVKSADAQGTYADILDNNHTGSRSWVVQYQNTGSHYNWGLAGVGSIDFDLTPGVWQYLTLTLDSSHVARLYIDGALVGTVAGPGPVVYDGTQFLRLSRWGGGGRNWKGDMDELNIWSFALTQDQILNQMHARPSGTEPGLAPSLRFDEGPGGTAADLTTNSHNAVLGGGFTQSQPAWVDSDAPVVTTPITNLSWGGFLVTLVGTDPDGDPLTAAVTSLPAHGTLYQTAGGVTPGAPLLSAPTAVSNAAWELIYIPVPGYSGADQFSYKLNDGLLDSQEAAVTLMVNPLSICTPAPMGLVAWWPGNGDAGDYFGTNQGVLMNRAAFGRGKSADAFWFDGQGGYVQVSAAADLVMTNALTVSAWILPAGPGTPNTGGIIINKEGEYEIARFADGTIRWAFANTSPGWNYLNTGFVAPLYRWTHVCVVYDNGTVSTYANGLLVHSYAGSGPIGDAFPGFNDFRIGGRQEEAQFFQGSIDEVAVFARPLQASEVQALYAAGSAGMCLAAGCLAAPAGATAWWPLQDSVSDIIGGHDPSATNTIAFEPAGRGVKLGTGGYIEIPSSPSLENQRFTLLAWVRPDGPGPNEDAYGSTIIQAPPVSGTDLPATLWRRASDGRFLFAYGGIGSEQIISSKAFPTGQLYQVAGTYDGTAFRLYVNGSLEGQAASTRTVKYGALPWTIGANPAAFRAQGFPRTWNGFIDDAMVFGRALSFQEIQALYRGGAVAPCAADLGVSVASSSVPTGNGPERIVTCTITVLNRGPDIASSVLLYDRLPAGMSLLSANSDKGQCSASQDVVTCSLDPLKPGDTASVTIVGVHALTGSLTNEVNISSSAVDPAPGDNTVIDIAPAQPACVSAPAGLVSWWRGENNGADALGLNPATLPGGVTFAQGMVGQAFSLDGVSGVLSIPDSASLRLTNLTVEGWFNFAAADGVRVLAGKTLGNGTFDSFGLWLENGVLHGAICDSSGFDNILSYPWLPALHRWYHLAYTFDQRAGAQALCLNGVVVASSAISKSIAYDNHPVLLGADNENTQLSFFFSGLMDEVSLYDRALSPAEIQSIFSAGSAGECAGAPIRFEAAAQIQTIRLLEPAGNPQQAPSSPGAPRKLALSWSGPAGRNFSIERSPDLARWTAAPAVVLEVTPGVYEAELPLDPAPASFFRLRAK